jgi:G3E family GTPase
MSKDPMTRAHIITGSFGAGKTTAIRWLMSRKPPDELWVVILNEFTDAGLDALHVAQSAHGKYDVRLVAGGCLCCVGELEFGKQVRDILRNLKPARLLIEPSGAAHAGQIIDELASYEAQHALKLDSIVCLIDPIDAIRIQLSRDTTEWSQIQSADVLLLSKQDLADALARQAFDSIVAEQFPAKRFVGTCCQGELPAEALLPYRRAAAFSLLEKSPATPNPTDAAFTIAGSAGNETHSSHLGFTAISWILPRELTFSRVVIEPRLQWLLEAYGGVLRRLKAVLRTGPGPSWSFQSHGRGLISEDSAYRRDSRVEIVLGAPPTPEYLESWRAMLRDAALTRARETNQ